MQPKQPGFWSLLNWELLSFWRHSNVASSNCEVLRDLSCSDQFEKQTLFLRAEALLMSSHHVSTRRTKSTRAQSVGKSALDKLCSSFQESSSTSFINFSAGFLLEALKNRNKHNSRLSNFVGKANPGSAWMSPQSCTLNRANHIRVLLPRPV